MRIASTARVSRRRSSRRWSTRGMCPCASGFCRFAFALRGGRETVSVTGQVGRSGGVAALGLGHRLARRLVGPLHRALERLRRDRPGRLVVVPYLLYLGLEDAHGATEAARDVGELLRAEEQHEDREDHEQLGKLKVSHCMISETSPDKYVLRSYVVGGLSAARTPDPVLVATRPRRGPRARRGSRRRRRAARSRRSPQR